jgi:copper chaperone CopZ
MQQTSLVIPHLDTESQALDLSSSLMSISGISHVEVDQSTRTLTVDYDERYLSEESLKEFVQGAGYPSQGDESPT